MTNKELKSWLKSRESVRLNIEETIQWIMDALQAIGCTINVEKLKKECKPLNLREVLYLVAYGNPNIPHAIRKKKVYLFNDDDAEFFSLNDKEWKTFWQHNEREFGGEDYIIPVK